MNRWWETVDSDLMDIVIRLRVKLNGKIIDRDWTKDLSLDYENLDEDMERIPSVLAFWSAVLAESRREKGIIEMKLDIRRSKVMSSIKEHMKEGVKLTNQDKEDLINVDQDYVKLKSSMIDVDSTVSKLFGIVESIKVKADNLRSFAAMKRAELSNS